MSLFSVGEDITIQSKTHPDFNGVQAVVLEVLTPSQRLERLERFTGERWIVNKSLDYYSYVLTVDSPEVSNGDGTIPAGARAWAEKSLRKQYKAGDSFDTLMNALKSGDKVGA